MAFRAQERGAPEGGSGAGAAMKWSARSRRRWQRPEGPDDLLARLDKLQDAANAASGDARNVYITFLLFGLYLTIIFGSTTHEQLLREGPVTLPLLNVGLPLFGFYWIAPALFVLLHLNLLLQFYLLSDKLHRFDEALQQALAKGLLDRERADERRAQLYPFPFSQMLVGRQHGRLMRFLLWLVVWLTVLVLPVVLLLMGQDRFLPYHDADTTMWLRFMVAADILLILIFWRAIRHPADRLLSHPARWLWHQSKVLAPGLVVLLLSFAILTYGASEGRFGDPMEEALFDRDGWLAWAVPASWRQEHNPRSGRSLVVQDANLVASWPTQGQIEQFGENLAWQNFGAPPNLRGRDLSYGSFAESIFVRASFRNANLEGASFFAANLERADLQGAKLKGASLWMANLQGAFLADANLQGADLVGANLQGADLQGANLQGADLGGTNLQGAVLGGAKLQAADLQQANLQGAQGCIRVASIGEGRAVTAATVCSDLQGADLQGANLQGANLGGTNLQGATLVGAKLQGADLRGAHLWRVLVDDESDLSSRWALADLTQADADQIGDLEAWIEEETAGITDEATRREVADRLRAALKDQGRPDVPAFPEAWASAPSIMFEPDDPLPQATGWSAPKWETIDAYDRELTEFLGVLACRESDAVARGLARRARVDEDRLYARRLATRLIADDCPSTTELPDDLRNRLEQLADSPTSD